MSVIFLYVNHFGITNLLWTSLVTLKGIPEYKPCCDQRFFICHWCLSSNFCPELYYTISFKSYLSAYTCAVIYTLETYFESDASNDDVSLEIVNYHLRTCLCLLLYSRFEIIRYSLPGRMISSEIKFALRQKCPYSGPYFPFSDWIRRDTEFSEHFSHIVRIEICNFVSSYLLLTHLHDFYEYLRIISN